MAKISHERQEKLFARPNVKSRESKRFENVVQWDDQKCNLLKIAKRMVKTNQDIIGEQNFY